MRKNYYEWNNILDKTEKWSEMLDVEWKRKEFNFKFQGNLKLQNG